MDSFMPGLMILVGTSAIVSGGYILRVVSHYAVGRLKTAGRLLSIWVFVLAGLFFTVTSLSLLTQNDRNDRDEARPPTERQHETPPGTGEK